VDVQEELDGVLHWITALLILLLQWLYPKVPQSHVLSRMFYDHLTLSRDFDLLSPHPFYILTLLYALRFWIKCSNVGETFFLFGALITVVTCTFLLYKPCAEVPLWAVYAKE